MSKEASIIFAAITVSWVLFIFNFVLGYYIGRWVEAADQITKKKKKTPQSKYNPQFPLMDFE